MSEFPPRTLKLIRSILGLLPSILDISLVQLGRRIDASSRTGHVTVSSASLCLPGLLVRSFSKSPPRTTKLIRSIAGSIPFISDAKPIRLGRRFDVSTCRNAGYA